MTRLRSIQFGDTEIRYRVARSARRKKTVAITVDPDEGVSVAAPLRTPNDEIAAIVRKRAGWILRKLGEQRARPQPRQLVSGESLYYLGREIPMVIRYTHNPKVYVRLKDARFRIECPDLFGEARRAALQEALVGWYKRRAEERMKASVEVWQSEVGIEPARITRVSIGDQKTLWGSCSTNGSLRFNWRLVMAHPTLINYVTVHELCHLLVASHSDRFWEQVARVMPDYKERRRRLRELEPMAFTL